MEHALFPITAPFAVPVPQIFGEPLTPKYTTLEGITMIMEELDSVALTDDEGMN